MVPRRRFTAGWLLAVAGALALTGCGGGTPQASPQAAQGIMTVLGWSTATTWPASNAPPRIWPSFVRSSSRGRIR